MMDGADMAIGYRHKRADPPLRLLNAWGWKLLVNGLFGYTARDIDCAFKLFRRRILDRVEVHSRGATFSAEFLIKSRRLGYVIRERAVSHYPRPAGQATGAKPAVILRAFRELWQLRLGLEADLAARRPHARRPAPGSNAHPARSWDSRGATPAGSAVILSLLIYVRWRVVAGLRGGPEWRNRRRGGWRGRDGWVVIGGCGSGHGSGESKLGLARVLASSQGPGEALEVAGGGLEEVLEVTLGVAPVAVTAEAMASDELG